MSRQVDADVVIAALRSIGAGLAEPKTQHANAVSNARLRVSRLIEQIDGQAVTSESRVTLDGATEIADESVEYADAGQFAAAWNARTPEQRESLVKWMGELADRVMRCAMQDHEGAVEMQRLAFMSSIELGQWADRLRRFAAVWVDRPQNGATIYSLATMEGEGDARHEVTHQITVTDLRRAAAIAQQLAHERIDHAVFVIVDEWVDAQGDATQIVAVDGRVLVDYEMVAAMLVAAGMRKS